MRGMRQGTAWKLENMVQWIFFIFWCQPSPPHLTEAACRGIQLWPLSPCSVDQDLDIFSFFISLFFCFWPGYVFVPSNISSGFGVDVVKSWEIRMQKMFHHFWFQSMPLRCLNRLTRVKPKNATNVCCMLLTRLTFFASLFLSAVLRLCTLYRPTHIPPSGFWKHFFSRIFPFASLFLVRWVGSPSPSHLGSSKSTLLLKE